MLYIYNKLNHDIYIIKTISVLKLFYWVKRELNPQNKSRHILNMMRLPDFAIYPIKNNKNQI